MQPTRPPDNAVVTFAFTSMALACLLVDVTVADATAPSYRALPPRPGSYLRMLFVDNFLKKNPNYTTTVSFSVYIVSSNTV